MRGIHPTRTERSRRRGPVRRAHGLDEGGCTDDVCDGIPCADLVEADRFRGDSVHEPFGVGEQLEQGECDVAHRRRQAGPLQLRANGGPRDVRMRGVARQRGSIRQRSRRCLPARHLKATSVQHAVAVRDQRALHLVPLHGGDGAQHARLVFGKGVEQRGDEHVARQPSHQI